MQFQIQGGEYVSLFAGALYIECTEWLVSDVHFSARVITIYFKINKKLMS